MPEETLLTLTGTERVAVAHELRRYGEYREHEGTELLDAHVYGEPGEPIHSGLTPEIERMAGAHYEVMNECEDLAAAFEGDEPITLSSEAIDLLGEAMDNAFADEFPPEVARTAMFARIAQRRLSGFGVLDPDEAGDFLVVHAETQSAATPEIAQVVSASGLQRLLSEHAQLRAQVVQLSERVDDLTAQVEAQRDQVGASPGQGVRRRLLPNLFAASADATDQPPALLDRGRGL
ncbi:MULTISPECIES: hypothetical protein [Micrococcales]|uniref:Uncharacterized protein n=2 Tax=Micrococcales TaxID=85006 RepID=A0A4Y3UQ65_9MICO|nr:MULTISPECIES: hypothetical protein [Micrococcales]TQM98671.1 hypothetical protein FHX68_1369 [Microbacterium lacticum]GEB96312.1 hypothetical protein MLA01_25310 [Microbacterium lacticum]GEC97897.1 hypothetical protein KVA01_00520 [Kocuria varians]GGI73477.1 hypothetical protein GCM10009724_25600 [Microbacterium lacticum]